MLRSRVTATAVVLLALGLEVSALGRVRPAASPCVAQVRAAPPELAADLAEFRRPIRSEPAYASGDPRYCLLVLGPACRTRVWLVLDGDDLYVDRDGTGDLTEAGKKVRLAKAYPSPNSLYSEQRQFLAGDLSEGKSGPTHTGLTVTHCVYNPKFVPAADEDKQSKELLDRNPGAAVVIVALHVKGRLRQVAAPAFSRTPADAPVLHFNGPLTFGFHAKWFYGWPVFQRGPAGTNLAVVMGTPGLGQGSFGLVGYDDVPEGAHPVAEVRFPSRPPGKAPLVVRVPLEHRC
jgi:hypothetical protein